MYLYNTFKRQFFCDTYSSNQYFHPLERQIKSTINSRFSLFLYFVFFFTVDEDRPSLTMGDVGGARESDMEQNERGG